MYVITAVDDGDLASAVRQVVSKRHASGQRLPAYFLSARLSINGAADVDGFLVLGTRLTSPDELCGVFPDDRPSVIWSGKLS